MANLPAEYTNTGGSTGAGGLKCHGKLLTPTNQKCVYRITINFTNTSTTPLFIPVELRMTAAADTTGGTFAAAITWNKKNPLDAETVQTTWQNCSANPTTSSATTVVSKSINSQETFDTGPLQLNGGQALTLWTTDSTSIGMYIRVEIVE